MIATLFLLLILAATIAALPQSERETGAIAAAAAVMTAAVLALSEAAFTLTPNGWLLAVAIMVAVISCPLGLAEADSGTHRWELR